MKNKDWELKLREQIPRLRRYARALTQQTAAADDLVQDCLVKAWDKRHSWQENSNLRAWLFSIMHNQFINNLRRNKVASDYLNSQTVEENRSYGETSMIMRDLELCISKLRPEFREVVLLAGLEGLSYKEIAEVTKAPIGTVMSRLSRGREELRQLMSDQKSSKVVRIK